MDSRWPTGCGVMDKIPLADRRAHSARRLAAILELHIQQGPVLEETKVQIGVVSGIVSLKRWKCVVTGFANHAGTTPMNCRKDALAAAAKHLLAVRDIVRAEPGTQVGTVGYLRAEPGAPNVIPGRVEFPVELRDVDAVKIKRIWQKFNRSLRRRTRKKVPRLAAK